MGKRTPPDSGSRWTYSTDRIVVISKKKTSEGMRFETRRVWREIRQVWHRGEIVSVVRYGNRARRLYDPKDFQSQLAKWSDGSAAIFYPSGRRMIATKPRLRFVFECDRPMLGHYR